MRFRKIPILLSDSYKKRVSKWVLDIVETLPKFQGGPIYQLQYERLHQREQAEKIFEETKPPEDVEISLIGFRLATRQFEES